ncbi:MAG: hypothetical protein AB1556_02885 [Bacillota bacterium]
MIIKAKFVSSDIENPFIGESFKQIPYETVRKTRDEILEVLGKYKLTIRQAATILDITKESLLDRF